ncbi:MAG: hypothetical protein ACJA2S_000666 [Cyclobacteriaceae bacterium]|jgi:uncharacterized protein YqgC (DUF456 family)
MDYLWIGAGIILLLAAVVGCFLPIVPGPPLGFGALLVLQLKEVAPFETSFLIIWVIITTVAFFLDYIIPPLTTKKFGGSRRGVIGSTIGLIIGLFFFPPFGLIIGAFVGAFVGEIIEGKEKKDALKSAFGALIGFLTGSLLKLTVVVTMGYYFVSSFF